jgi:transcriptional regulator with XRE-family HTH domain
MSLGERVRKRRQELGLTQKELAQALRVTPQHISVVEQDKRVPSLSSLANLAQELGVTIDYLVTGRESILSNSAAAVKADSRLPLQSKRALVTLIEDLHKLSDKGRS